MSKSRAAQWKQDKEPRSLSPTISLTQQRPQIYLEHSLKTLGPNQYHSELCAYETKEAQLENQQQAAQPKEKGKNNPSNSSHRGTLQFGP